jgi:hypothetical protein
MNLQHADKVLLKSSSAVLVEETTYEYGSFDRCIAGKKCVATRFFLLEITRRL